MAKPPITLPPIAPVFIYKGINARNRAIKGRISEETIGVAKVALKRQGITVTSIKKQRKSPLTTTKITNKDITFFTRQVSTMLRSGVDLISGFDVILSAVDKPALKQLIQQIKSDVEGGSAFYQALRKHPKHFDSLFVALVETGEGAGALQTMLERIALYKEKNELIKLKVKKAFRYPAFILIVSLLITTMLLLKVIPVFKNLFDSSKVPLPVITQFVIKLSEIVKHYGIFIVGIVGGSGWYLKQRLVNDPKLQHFFQRISLKLPILGKILQKSIVARFSRTLATTVTVGLPLVDALEASAKASGNIVYQEIIMDIRSDVQGGQSLTAAMRSTALFDGQILQMTQVGEESGSLDEMLNKVADFYEIEVDAAIDGLTVLLEPMIIVFLGFIVGGLVLAMYMPIFKLGKAF